MQNKIKFAFASVIGAFLFSSASVFAAYTLPNIGESLGKSMYQIGLVLGIFIGLPILVSAFSDAKKEGVGEEGLIPKEIFKYIIPIILIVSILAIFLAPQTDTMGQLVGGIFSGIFMFALPAILMRFLMGGVKGMETGFETRTKNWIKGKEPDDKFKKIEDFFKVNKELMDEHGFGITGFTIPTPPTPAGQPAERIPETPAEHAQVTNTAAKVSEEHTKQHVGGEHH